MKRTYRNIYKDGTEELVEYDVADEVPTDFSYTEEQLETKSSTELKAILTNMGISTTMNKENMIKLILATNEFVKE